MRRQSRFSAFFVASILLAFSPTLSHSQVALCRAVKDDKQRLECYDRATGLGATSQSSVGAQKGSPSVPEITNEMRGYVAALDRRFLEAGSSLNVFIVNQDTKGLTTPGVGYPSLHFFGFFNRAAVYAIATKALDSLREPRTRGFLTVEFQDKGSEGVWRFDLRKSAPICARDLCF